VGNEGEVVRLNGDGVSLDERRTLRLRLATGRRVSIHVTWVVAESRLCCQDNSRAMCNKGKKRPSLRSLQDHLV